jgi:hypothetical protein
MLSKLSTCNALQSSAMASRLNPRSPVEPSIDRGHLATPVTQKPRLFACGSARHDDERGTRIPQWIIMRCKNAGHLVSRADRPMHQTGTTTTAFCSRFLGGPSDFHPQLEKRTPVRARLPLGSRRPRGLIGKRLVNYIELTSARYFLSRDHRRHHYR